jgi:hypothetical protein
MFELGALIFAILFVVVTRRFILSALDCSALGLGDRVTLIRPSRKSIDKNKTRLLQTILFFASVSIAVIESSPIGTKTTRITASCFKSIVK